MMSYDRSCGKKATQIFHPNWSCFDERFLHDVINPFRKIYGRGDVKFAPIMSQFYMH